MKHRATLNAINSTDLFDAIVKFQLGSSIKERLTADGASTIQTVRGNTVYSRSGNRQRQRIAGVVTA